MYKREKAIHEQLGKLGKIDKPPSIAHLLRGFVLHGVRFGLYDGITHLAEGLGQRHGWLRYISRKQPQP